MEQRINHHYAIVLRVPQRSFRPSLCLRYKTSCIADQVTGTEDLGQHYLANKTPALIVFSLCALLLILYFHSRATNDTTLIVGNLFLYIYDGLEKET